MPRKLTPRECERLQTLPDDYSKWDENGNVVSNFQRYKALGNAYTVDVIVYFFQQLLVRTKSVE